MNNNKNCLRLIEPTKVFSLNSYVYFYINKVIQVDSLNTNVFVIERFIFPFFFFYQTDINANLMYEYLYLSSF